METVQTDRIKKKITQLKKLDTGLAIFSAERHQYRLNPVLPIDTVRQFEKKNGILLPEGYTQFITEIGNGGAGPFYGIEPLENSLFVDLDYKEEHGFLNPALPFPHCNPWNMEFESKIEDEDS